MYLSLVERIVSIGKMIFIDDFGKWKAAASQLYALLRKNWTVQHISQDTSIVCQLGIILFVCLPNSI